MLLPPLPLLPLLPLAQEPHQGNNSKLLITRPTLRPRHVHQCRSLLPLPPLMAVHLTISPQPLTRQQLMPPLCNPTPKPLRQPTLLLFRV